MRPTPFDEVDIQLERDGAQHGPADRINQAAATWVVGCQRWGCQGIGSGFEMVQVTRRQSPD